ncbi:PepSY domain-containing protein [Prosthecodimorpha staleyi]|uniref:PepSY domain-containing protein n=1 Tax=Prosthecodimorpha staleyi TaxID=2840188 RepID=A0A947D1J3_9HYPH|nr:PepSY domain-containing protein [Prosthecodimorpha staleyi]MBT9288563.1 PepSY domain-containing protein [Prosthecodimorpha staleyi]
MQKFLLSAAAFAFVATASGVAMAGPACTKEPRDKWLSEEAMKTKVAELGFKVKTFKISGPCYEIYGWNKDGRKAEVYFNPTNGEIVKAEIGG